MALSISIESINTALCYQNKENANASYLNPESQHKAVADLIMGMFTLEYVLPKNISKLHKCGEIHIHDLPYFPTRPYCASHDLRIFLKRGFPGYRIFNQMPNSAPPTRPLTAIEHAAKILKLAHAHFSGGQAFFNWNIFLGPYLVDCSFKKMKKLAQFMYYQFSELPAPRGNEGVFSDINVEFGVPKFLADLPACLPGGIISENLTYSDFDDVCKKFLFAIISVALEGDSKGHPFPFPKLNFTLRKEHKNKYKNAISKEFEISYIEDKLIHGIPPTIEELYYFSHLLASVNGAPYYLNLLPEYMPENVNSQCCRLLVKYNEEDYFDLINGSMRTSTLQNVSINLPQVAYRNKDEDKVYDRLNEICEIIKKIMEIKANCIEKRMKNGFLPFLSMKLDNEVYYRLDRVDRAIGIVGLNECVKFISGEELHESVDAHKLGLRIVYHLSNYCKELSKVTGHKWHLTQTPGESTCHRLALIDKKNFPDKAIVQGEGSSVYYTNSTHINPKARIPLLKKVLLESAFHPLIDGGAIHHIWLGEARPSVQALIKLSNKISTQTLCSYWAYTLDYTHCNPCSKIFNGVYDTCPKCNSQNIASYSRITGYYTAITDWNKGKLAEFKNRYRYLL